MNSFFEKKFCKKYQTKYYKIFQDYNDKTFFLVKYGNIPTCLDMGMTHEEMYNIMNKNNGFLDKYNKVRFNTFDDVKNVLKIIEDYIVLYKLSQ